MVFIFFLFLNSFYPVYTIYTRMSATFSAYCTLYFSKLDQDDALKKSLFDFLNSYLMPWEKSLTSSKKPLKMGFKF